ncbi:type II secretion system minor pseudopilin GspI [Musicola paradisiaca]|uniref:Type II secretion system protein I n=1 Tax=Musicola paradisiaca (strain Ech703) TaxID=579405 RepID=C6C310_MUSP7|nr:type II secretion system minor pseudopilin GspI [Musicola paradisiaca]ACS85275.1 general secretion pathway protein I [Musicola paradisiaca Ech703]
MKQRGMTLLEVMVALVIFALAGLTVLRTTAQQSSMLSRLEEKTFAVWIAENQLAVLRLEKRQPETFWLEGETRFAGTIWYWRMLGADAGVDKVRSVDVEVRHEKDNGAADAVLRSYVIRQDPPREPQP